MKALGKRDDLGFQWWKGEIGRITRWVLYRNGFETGLFIDRETRGATPYTLWKAGASPRGCALHIGWHKTVGEAKTEAMRFLTTSVHIQADKDISKESVNAIMNVAACVLAML